MKILVTGGAGFIGSAVVRLAVSRGHSVVNLDALTYAASLENVAPVSASPLYAFEHADIRDRAALDRVFDTHQPDAVMHLAAESHVLVKVLPGVNKYLLNTATTAYGAAHGRSLDELGPGPDNGHDAYRIVRHGKCSQLLERLHGFPLRGGQGKGRKTSKPLLPELGLG